MIEDKSRVRSKHVQTDGVFIKPKDLLEKEKEIKMLNGILNEDEDKANTFN